MRKLSKYSFGIGDRFQKQGAAQLQAIIKGRELGIDITPVWNKSNREHLITGTTPLSVRKEAEEAVKKSGWDEGFFVDADHINLETVDRFTDSSDFFTIDVASYTGKDFDEDDMELFMNSCRPYLGKFTVPGIEMQIDIDENILTEIASKFLYATIMAGEIYRKIESKKGKGNFITEISMDEVEQAQTPVELFFILLMLSNQNVPVQTIAPKFPGRFNKGVDYKGDISKFKMEFEQVLMVIDFAVREFGLPEELKLSIHSGSDKFSIYPVIGKLIRKYDKGIHIKTAGTTWLEEVIGLAKAGGEALQFVKDIYYQSLDRIDELTKPYADVIDISLNRLPDKKEVESWNSNKMFHTLQHNPVHPDYNSNMRQLMHVAYKIAAERIDDFRKLQSQYASIIGQCVTENLFERHILRIFRGG